MPKRREDPLKDKTTIENHNYFEDFMDTNQDTMENTFFLNP